MIFTRIKEKISKHFNSNSDFDDLNLRQKTCASSQKDLKSAKLIFSNESFSNCNDNNPSFNLYDTYPDKENIPRNFTVHETKRFVPNYNNPLKRRHPLKNKGSKEEIGSVLNLKVIKTNNESEMVFKSNPLYEYEGDWSDNNGVEGDWNNNETEIEGCWDDNDWNNNETAVEGDWNPVQEEPIEADFIDKDEINNTNQFENVENMFSKIRHNRLENVLEMLENDYDVESIDKAGNSMLHICAQNNLRKMAMLVIEKGCPINLQNKKGYTALDLCDIFKFNKLGDWLVLQGAHGSQDL